MLAINQRPNESVVVVFLIPVLELTAVTRARTRVFSSAIPSVYGASLAPGIVVQEKPSDERCHAIRYVLPMPLPVCL